VDLTVLAVLTLPPPPGGGGRPGRPPPGGGGVAPPPFSSLSLALSPLWTGRRSGASTLHRRRKGAAGRPTGGTLAHCSWRVKRGGEGWGPDGPGWMDGRTPSQRIRGHWSGYRPPPIGVPFRLTPGVVRRPRTGRPPPFSGVSDFLAAVSAHQWRGPTGRAAAVGCPPPGHFNLNYPPPHHKQPLTQSNPQFISNLVRFSN